MSSSLPHAAIDIGSNTIHLLVARPANGYWDRLASVAEVTELGRLVALNGDLPDRVRPMIRQVLEQQIAQARNMGAQTIIIGATEAVRRAPRGAAIMAQLSLDLQRPIHILTGERESQLGFLGARPLLSSRQHQLLIDTGGGSTQISLSRGVERLAGASLPLGSGVLSVQVQCDPPSPSEWAALSQPISEALSDQAPQGPQPDEAVALGGCARNLLKLASPRNDQTLTQNDIDDVLRQLLTHSSAELAGRTGVDPRRVKIAAIGGLILSAILRHYGLPRLRVSAYGLREGMLEAHRQWGADWWKEQAYGTVSASARAGTR